MRPFVVVSNRGPVSFREDPPGSGRVVARRGAGGLVSGLGPLVRDSGVLWVAAAMTEGDRIVAEQGVVDAEGFRTRLLAFAPERWDAYYDQVCNAALWFVHHGLFDPVYAPAWPPGWVDAQWQAYREVNAAFARAVAADAPERAVVLVQDYHLCLLAPELRRSRPDLDLVHFSHTPFAPPAWLAQLPASVAEELVAGLAAHRACGFHTSRWRDDFVASCRAHGVEPPATFVAPLGPDPDDLAATAASEAARRAGAELDALVADRRFLVRVDRIELSKNVVRGFQAYEALLEAEPAWRGRVTFGAFLYPSRLGVADYDRYAQAVAEQVLAVNERFATPGWTPIVYDPTDDYPRSVAALVRADVVLVNPIRDGLNLVAKEAAVLNRRNGQLVLSTGAGAWDELGSAGAWGCDPFDIGATAEALAGALGADESERLRRAESMRAAALARGPGHWLADQLAAAP
jgi:trehalose 6-phosphate synthase